MTSETEKLIERLEAATGPDRELDFWLTVLVHDPIPAEDLAAVRLDLEQLGVDAMHVEAPYTGSLGEVVTLAKRKGFYIRSEPRFHIDGERVDFISYALRPRWDMWLPDDEWFDRGEGRHSDQAISALIALLTALETSHD
ncbi:hypothetical protein [Phenylobacterium sp.]|uniref:hypothetical protein n=1 Tax=Phenylobacterium sp. TaxID=1871053 RepID=UPI0026270BD7|nr:hypothetical protein [Phenylobacterium sp.]